MRTFYLTFTAILYGFLAILLGTFFSGSLAAMVGFISHPEEVTSLSFLIRELFQSGLSLLPIGLMVSLPVSILFGISLILRDKFRPKLPAILVTTKHEPWRFTIWLILLTLICLLIVASMMVPTFLYLLPGFILGTLCLFPMWRATVEHAPK